MHKSRKWVGLCTVANIRKILDHPIVPLALGVGVIMKGPYDLVIRGIALVILGLWLIYDIGQYIKKKQWGNQWKIGFFCFVILATFLAIVEIQHATKEHRLEEEQENVYSRLSANMYLPPDGDVYLSELRIVNGGSVGLAKHRIICGVKRLITTGGGGIVNLGEWVDPKTDRGGIITGGNPSMDNTPIHAGGDAESNACLSLLTWATPVKCADVVVGVMYTLESQPQIIKVKPFRFVAKRYGDGPMWSQQPYEYEGSYCR